MENTKTVSTKLIILCAALGCSVLMGYSQQRWGDWPYYVRENVPLLISTHQYPDVVEGEDRIKIPVLGLMDTISLFAYVDITFKSTANNDSEIVDVSIHSLEYWESEEEQLNNHKTSLQIKRLYGYEQRFLSVKEKMIWDSTAGLLLYWCWNQPYSCSRYDLKKISLLEDGGNGAEAQLFIRLYLVPETVPFSLTEV